MLTDGHITLLSVTEADPGGREVYIVGLQLDCWGRGFESL
jgi:hypothetical protein